MNDTTHRLARAYAVRRTDAAFSGRESHRGHLPTVLYRQMSPGELQALLEAAVLAGAEHGRRG